jgi:hypothetical protein
MVGTVLILLLISWTAHAAIQDGTIRAYVQMDGDTMRYVQCQGICGVESRAGAAPPAQQR